MAIISYIFIYFRYKFTLILFEYMCVSDNFVNAYILAQYNWVTHTHIHASQVAMADTDANGRVVELQELFIPCAYPGCPVEACLWSPHEKKAFCVGCWPRMPFHQASCVCDCVLVGG